MRFENDLELLMEIDNLIALSIEEGEMTIEQAEEEKLKWCLYTL